MDTHPTSFHRHRDRRQQSLEIRSFLLDHRAPTAPAILRAAGLAAYAYPALPPDDSRRDALRPDYLRSLQRHHHLRGDLASLLRAWSDAGVEALLFKGFHLSEFVYPSPGMRFHGDVDMVVRAESAERAVAIARATGWSDASHQRTFSDHVCALFGPAGTKIDLHRYMLHRRTRWARAPQRITRAVWERSERIEWEGTTLRRPAAVDALLVGLILQRMWGDRGYLKPHDFIDARLLFERVSRAEAAGRARELRCERTLEYFLGRCDPDRGRLAFHRSRTDRLRLGWITGRERGFLTGRHRWATRLVRAPGLAVDIARVLPDVLAARRRLRAGADLREIFRRASPELPDRASSEHRRYRTVRGVRWATRLLGLDRGGDCLLRSVACYTALRRQGWPVAFVSGVRRDGGSVVGHAWLELDGHVLPDLREPWNRTSYREGFRWPRTY